MRTIFIIEGFALSAGVHALGDVNRDGFDDFAVTRIREDSALAEAGLIVFHGSSDLVVRPPADVFNLPKNLDVVLDSAIRIRQAPDRELTGGLSLYGDLFVTSGDFDGDGKRDLAVGRTSSILADSDQDFPAANEIIDRQERGKVFVFFAVADKAAELVLDDADVILKGAGNFDQFGTLATSPGISPDDDGLNDLVVGAALADGLIGQAKPDAGKLYFISGARRTAALPTTGIVELSNTSVSGSGEFLVDRATGQPENFGVTLPAGKQEQWFRFTTLGDGQPGDHILLSPEARPATTTRLRPVDEGTLIGDTLDSNPANPLVVEAESRRGVLEFNVSSESVARLLGVMRLLGNEKRAGCGSCCFGGLFVPHDACPRRCVR